MLAGAVFAMVSTECHARNAQARTTALGMLPAENWGGGAHRPLESGADLRSHAEPLDRHVHRAPCRPAG